jgi:hypothetical protein
LRTKPGPEAEWAEVTPNLGWLLLGSVLAAGLVNAGPIATDLLASDDLFQRVELGLFAGSAAAMVTFVLGLRSKLAGDERADADSIFDAISDNPIEG